jgi:DNA repair exonuclease SbcCD nuclease subunit
MKFAHISDTHLGQYRSKIDRENDTYDAFSQAIAKSIEAKVDFVILSGDIFD